MSLDDYVNGEHPVRMIDAFFDELDLASIGFEELIPMTELPVQRPHAVNTGSKWPSRISLLSDPKARFTVIAHNETGRWRIVESAGVEQLPPDKVAELSSGLDTSSERKGRSHVVTVFLNNRCNLRCGYCRFEPLTHHAVEFGNADVDRVLNAVASVTDGAADVELHFQGGEPLLEIKLIDRLCQLLDVAKPGKYQYHVTTNGTLLTDPILEVLQRHRIKITVSLDGPAPDNDRLRIFANGRGSHGKVLQTVRTLQQQAIPFGIFAVVSDPSRLVEIYEYFVNQVGLTSFLLSPLEFDGSTSAHEIDAYLSCFIDGQFEILNRNINTYEVSGIRISENLTEKYLQAKIFPGLHSKACGATPFSRCGQDMHSVERDGTVTECQNTRLIQSRGKAYIDACIARFELCDSCEIRAHCSSPICFSRLKPEFNHLYALGEAGARQYVATICEHLKRRERKLFELFYNRKEQVLDYYFARRSVVPRVPNTKE